MTSVAEIGASGAKVEEKLFQNRYLVDAGRPHIKVRPHETPSKALLSLSDSDRYSSEPPEAQATRK